MPPQSRGKGKGRDSPLPVPVPVPAGFQSKSTPNLPTLRSLNTIIPASTSTSTSTSIPNGTANNTPARRHGEVHDHPRDSTLSPDITGDSITSPSEPASIEDFALDSVTDFPPLLSPNLSDEESDQGEEEAEDGHVPNLPPRPIYHHHSRSHTYLAPSAFAPPFYNRPPTPLPPSPSLTSLLRPNFTTHNSRPTTPDASSDEASHPPPHPGDATGTQTPNSAAASTLTNTYRSAKPIPRASPKVPTYEYYGFTLYLASSLAFIVYVLWAFLPSPFLHQLGIYYYPNRWWALAIPAWTVMLIVYIYVALAAFNIGTLTLKLGNVDCLVDEAANVAIVDAEGNLIRSDKSAGRGQLGEGHVGKSSVRKKSGGKGRRRSVVPPGSRRSSAGKIQMNPGLDWRTLWNEGTDAVMDIPIGGVCEILYGAFSDDEDEDDTPCELSG